MSLFFLSGATSRVGGRRVISGGRGVQRTSVYSRQKESTFYNLHGSAYWTSYCGCCERLYRTLVRMFFILCVHIIYYCVCLGTYLLSSFSVNLDGEYRKIVLLQRSLD